MNRNWLGLAAAGTAVLFAVTGCKTNREVQKKAPPGRVGAFSVVDAAPDQTAKGYVEFITVNREKPVPIMQLDKEGEQYLISYVGLDEGDSYRARRYASPVVETLRVAEPAGTHTFVIEKDGQRVEVPVTEGKITPVEINYDLVDSGDLFATYRMKVRVFEPVEYQTAQLNKQSVIKESEATRITTQ